MNKEEMRLILSGILRKEQPPLDPPTENDWLRLEKRFSTTFPSEFKTFIVLMSEFSFPGEIYNVHESDNTNGNDLIETIYKAEVASGWPTDFIPFYGIGNGDYFALNSQEGIVTQVYYRYHEDGRFDCHSKSFDIWVRQLPAFLRGEN